MVKAAGWQKLRTAQDLAARKLRRPRLHRCGCLRGPGTPARRGGQGGAASVPCRTRQLRSSWMRAREVETAGFTGFPQDVSSCRERLPASRRDCRVRPSRLSLERTGPRGAGAGRLPRGQAAAGCGEWGQKNLSGPGMPCQVRHGARPRLRRAAQGRSDCRGVCDPGQQGFLLPSPKRRLCRNHLVIRRASRGGCSHGRSLGLRGKGPVTVKGAPAWSARCLKAAWRSPHAYRGCC